MTDLAAIPPPGEAASLARDMADAYVKAVRFYRERLGLAPAEAEARARELAGPDAGEHALNDPADRVSWWSLAGLAERSREEADLAWHRILAEARDEFVNGHRAARIMEWEGTPWERAQYIAMREAFLDEWKPRGGIELALIDMLTQAYVGYQISLHRFQLRSIGEGESEDDQLRRQGRWQAPRQTTADATEQAAQMADRFHRLFMRTLRALRDQRRYAPSVVVQNAQQVNLGAQQVNMAGAGLGVDARAAERAEGNAPHDAGSG